MTKRLASLVLAIAMFLQILVPQTLIAKEEMKAPSDKLVTVGVINADSYDSKLIEELEKNKPEPEIRLFGYFEDGQEPKDGDKLEYHGEVKAKLSVKGLDENPFQWNEVFGTEELHLRFIQLNDDTGVETGVERVLNISKADTYTWTDGEGNPAELPLFNNNLEPLVYEVKLDEEVSDKVKLLTARLTSTGNALPTFEKPDAEGRIKYHLTLEIGLQQVASSKFVSEWHTAVAENERPQIEGTMTGSMLSGKSKTINLKLPTNDNDEVIVKTNSRRDKNKFLPEFLFKTPTVKVDTSTAGLTFEEADGVKTVKSGDHKFKYDFSYDVINGGKLVMTEVIPVTFDANGGKFDSITDPTAEQKIIKEVEYDGTLTDKAENPIKQGKAFKGWATDAEGTTLATDSDYANLTAAKTFYAIWSDEDIQVDQLEVAESKITFRKNGTQNITNDFVPTFEDLKAQVKVKDVGGNFVPLPTTGVTFSIVYDEGKEYTEDSVDLKKFIYEKVKENNKDEVSRTETVKAKIKYDNGTEREIEIPIKVLKNIYKGTDQGGKYPHIPENYVRVTIDPTDKAQDPQKTYYYVNPKAKVIVPVTDPVGAGDNKFSKWTMKADSATGDGADYTKADRHQFTEASTITAQYGAGTIKIQYVDQNGNEIDAKYQIAGNDYPSEKTGGLGKEADELQFAKKGPDFKGYIFDTRDSIKGKHYNDPADPDNLDTVKYKYNKKITTDTPKNPNVYFPVIFDANTGEFRSDPKEKKTVYVYFDPSTEKTVGKVTFKEVKDEFEKAYSNPTKDGFDFKEWQNAKTNGTKVADNYEIQFQGWDSVTYEAKVETFYAHYEQASAFVKYLDLDGNPIADEFKIDTEKYPTEKEGKAGETIAKDVFTAETAPKLIGYKFNRIELNPKDGKYAIDKKATIKIYYEEVPDVIPANPDGSNPDEVPADYVRVEFVPTEKGTLEGNKIFFVNPKKEVTIPVKDPVGKDANTFVEWKIGKNVEGEKYTPSTPKKFENDTTITAVYTTDVIEQPGDKKPDTVPKDFVKVTVVPTDKATVDTNKIYWVAPNKEVTIPFAKPVGKEVPVSQVDPKNPKAYKWVFTKWTSDETPVRTWDKDIDTGIVGTFTKETTITAQYDKSTTEQGSVVADEITVHESYKDGDTWVNNFIPTEDELKAAVKVTDANGTPTALPSEATVEIVLGKDANGSDYTDLATELYDKLQEKNDGNKPSRIETVKAKVTFKNGEVQDVEIPIKVIKNIYEAKTLTEKPIYVPKDYVKVTLNPTTKAQDPQKTYFYVNPDAKVLIPGSDPEAISGFKFINWTTPGKDANGNEIDVPYQLTERHQFDKETTITANYVNEKDIIEFDPKKPVTKPEGFITVSFDADLGLKLTDIKFYHVKIGAKDTNEKPLTLAALTKPKYQAASGYEFNGWDKPDTTPIGDQDIVVTALAKQASSPDKPGDEPGYRPSYPEIIYRDRIVEKEKIVEKIVKVGENDELLKEIRYMQGYNGKFRPYDGLTRAEAAQILANALKADGYRYDANYNLSYSDVGNKWYTDAIRVVTQANVFQGYSDGTFRPQSKITRAEWVATLRRFQGLKEANGNAMMLRSGHWATAEVEAAYEAGWLGVYQDGTAKFDADKPITRQEVAYVSNRAFRRVLDKVYLRRSVNTLLTYKDINLSMPLYEDILCASNTLLTDNKYYKANTIVMDNVTFNIVTDDLLIHQKKFQYNVNR